LSRSPLRKAGGASVSLTDWESREGGVGWTRSFTHSLYQSWTDSERETRVWGRVCVVSLLKQVSFLLALILQHLCTRNNVKSDNRCKFWSREVANLQRLCSIRVDVKRSRFRACCSPVVLFTSKLFYKPLLLNTLSLPVIEWSCCDVSVFTNHNFYTKLFSNLFSWSLFCSTIQGIYSSYFVH